MIAERRWSKLAKKPVILMGVVALVGQDDIPGLSGKLRQNVFDLIELIRQTAIAQGVDRDRRAERGYEGRQTRSGLSGPIRPRRSSRRT